MIFMASLTGAAAAAFFVACQRQWNWKG